MEVDSAAGLNPRRWAPSRRERRKYAGLFLRSDTDQDGFVQAGEAKALMERSGLEDGRGARRMETRS